MTDPERFGWAELAAHLPPGASTADIARQLGTYPRRIERARRNGLTANTADLFAVRLGTHPGLVWATWWDVPLEVQAEPARTSAQRAPAGALDQRGRKALAARRAYRRRLAADHRRRAGSRHTVPAAPGGATTGGGR